MIGSFSAPIRAMTVSDYAYILCFYKGYPSSST